MKIIKTKLSVEANYRSQSSTPKTPYLEVQLNAVKKDGYYIQCIKNPCLEVQLEAVKQDGDSIAFIKDPCLQVQLEAVKEKILV